MDIAQFAGTFVALPHALELGLPTAHENSLWQVWLRGDGMYWITALERQEHDADAGYTISPETLRDAFRPLPREDNAAPQLAAASTDLLQYWYTKRRLVSGADLRQISAPSASVENGADIVRPSDPAAEPPEPDEQHGGESYFDPHVHFGHANDDPDFATPQSMSQAYNQDNTPPQTDAAYDAKSYGVQENGVQRFEEMPFLHLGPGHNQVPGSAPNEPVPPHTFGFPPTHSAAAAPPPAFIEPPASTVPPVPLAPFEPQSAAPKTKQSSGVQALAEGRMKVVEQAMRQEFALLLEHLRDDKSPELLGEIEKLIQREAPYTWKQKYMFSEFGLALRREQQHHLALLCHQKALECSPRDENVLFNLARAEMELGNTARAKAHLQEALACAPHFTAAKNFLTFLSAR